MKTKKYTEMKTVKDLKKYLADFNDSDILSDICIKQVKPTGFYCTITCTITLNEYDCDDAAKMIEQKLKSTFCQKIDIDNIDCELACESDDDDDDDDEC